MHYFDLIVDACGSAQNPQESMGISMNTGFRGKICQRRHQDTPGEHVVFLSCTRSWETSYDLCLGQCLRISEVLCIFGAQQDCVECPPTCTSVEVVAPGTGYVT